MINHISQKVLMTLFIEELKEPLKSLTRAFSPFTLKEAIQRALLLEEIARSETSAWGEEKRPHALGPSEKYNKKIMRKVVKQLAPKDAWLNQKKKGERKISLRGKPMVGRMEVLPQLVSAHKMEEIAQKGDIVWGATFLMIKGKPTPTSKEITSLVEIQEILEKHKDVFGDMPNGLLA